MQHYRKSHISVPEGGFSEMKRKGKELIGGISFVDSLSPDVGSLRDATIDAYIGIVVQHI